eukprot:scaffold50269_cov57-Phaeocystis_antarctica.AAC.2
MPPPARGLGAGVNTGQSKLCRSIPSERRAGASSFPLGCRPASGTKSPENRVVLAGCGEPHSCARNGFVSRVLKRKTPVNHVYEELFRGLPAIPSARAPALAKRDWVGFLS